MICEVIRLFSFLCLWKYIIFKCEHRTDFRFVSIFILERNIHILLVPFLFRNKSFIYWFRTICPERKFYMVLVLLLVWKQNFHILFVREQNFHMVFVLLAFRNATFVCCLFWNGTFTCYLFRKGTFTCYLFNQSCNWKLILRKELLTIFIYLTWTYNIY